MNGNNSNKEAMDDLLSGLTRPVRPGEAPPGQEPDGGTSSLPAQKPKGRRGRPPRSGQWEKAFLVVNSERYAKIRAIAQLSGKNIKDIADRAFADYIRKVESEHGVIRIQRKLELPE